MRKQKKFIRTDLAIEAREVYGTNQIDGVKFTTQDF